MKVIIIGIGPISFSECIRMRNEVDDAIARYGEEIVDKAFEISQRTPYPWKNVLKELLRKGEDQS